MTRDENPRTGYHVDLELSDRSQELLEIRIPLGDYIGCC